MLNPYSRNSRKATRAKGNTFRPGIESCEDRLLMSGVQAYLDQGTLKVLGTSANETITITSILRTPALGPEIFIPEISTFFPAGGFVSAVMIDTGGGSDTVVLAKGYAYYQPTTVYNVGGTATVVGLPSVANYYGELSITGTDDKGLISVSAVPNSRVWGGPPGVSVSFDLRDAEVFDAASIQHISIDAGKGDDQVSVGGGPLNLKPGPIGLEPIVISRAVTIPSIIQGGEGNDTLYGGLGSDDINGGAGDDVLYGFGGNDHLYGGTGNDLLYDSGGRNYLYGGTRSEANTDSGNEPDVLDVLHGTANDVMDDGWVVRFNHDSRAYGGDQYSTFLDQLFSTYRSASGRLVGNYIDQYGFVLDRKKSDDAKNTQDRGFGDAQWRTAIAAIASALQGENTNTERFLKTLYRFGFEQRPLGLEPVRTPTAPLTPPIH